VPRMSIIPNTERLRAASMPGKHAFTIGFMSRSSASDDTIARWFDLVYILFSMKPLSSSGQLRPTSNQVPLIHPEIPISLTATSTGLGSHDF
jgi:hypothetical protein